MRRAIKRLTGNARGATAIEYGLIAALIALGALTGIQAFANGALGTWNKVSNAASGNM